MIQVPGLTTEANRFIKEELISKTALLSFHIVDDESDHFRQIAKSPNRPPQVNLLSESYFGAAGSLVDRPYLQSKDLGVLKKFLGVHPTPLARRIGIERVPTPTGDEYRTWLLNQGDAPTGASLMDAFTSLNADEHRYEVNLRFAPEGAAQLEALTQNNIGKKMAVALDGQVRSAPIIQSSIAGGQARITMGDGTMDETLKEAEALSLVLISGALPTSLTPLEERTVGATLGSDAIAKGQTALLAALVLVVAMMALYYKGAGLIGIIALLFNAFFLFAALSAMGATLTLPGIAGLVLAVGMAVDANIIQFERIRAELRAGQSIRGAVDAGFKKAFSAIFDANLTTLLAAIVLYQYGSGPIRGFATTLGVGVLINSFTAISIPRLIFEFFTRRKLRTLSI